jgi:class 3 adenylate cyclase
MSPDTAANRLLIVDDSRTMRAALRRALEEIGCRRIEEASHGREALEKLAAAPFDLVLLDLDMPEMDGRETLRAIKSHPDWKVIPVIIVSGSGQESNAISCITAGAEDFLNKPFDPVLLRARVVSSIERKQLRDQDRQLLAQLHREKKLVEQEKANSDRLLLSILPAPIKHRLQSGEKEIADSHPAVTIGFVDIVGFSSLARQHTPAKLLSILDRFFGEFDRIVDTHGAEKIKTIGDNFMFACGVPLPEPRHAQVAADCALEMMAAFKSVNSLLGTKLAIRCGLHSGPVVAGIIGKKKFAYDIWGDAVNIASRMESTSTPGKIHISRETRELLGNAFIATPRGPVECKGIGSVEGFFLEGRVPVFEVAGT